MEQVSINQRLNLIVDTFEKGKKAAFARKVGMSPQGAQELLAGRKGDPSFKVLVKILESYPQVRMEWLILGNGQMLLREDVVVDEVDGPQVIVSYSTLDAELLETIRQDMQQKFEKLDKQIIRIFDALDMSVDEFSRKEEVNMFTISMLNYSFDAVKGDDEGG